MRRGGYVALEAAGLVITALAAQTVIRGVLDRSEVLWGILNWVPGGLTGQLIALGCIALVGMVAGGWAHTRQRPNIGRAGDSAGSRGRGKL
ncbi:hypothetical protein [Streptomyces violaceusniger]|uniref:Uncharacterized protein n=1 Tax=Streptomyces violaceusniger (strain Tu 4113) TaxID=653045 RepID=G2NWG7_STRV4|nr:hypothetical protein [Streptomyces violaceusniger]AEM86852.1 hypothetical protein Strvi_7500 [Streptomyces violaceusniger Tu 4113]